MTFVEKDGTINKCILSKAVQQPTYLPKYFRVVMLEAGQEPPQASVKDLFQFQKLISNYLEVTCE
jgi:hypothetical protein